MGGRKKRGIDIRTLHQNVNNLESDYCYAFVFLGY